MADKTVQESLDEVVKAIGFGIVSDFRELYDAMRDISSDVRTGNEILGRVNINIEDINKSLDDYATKRFRDKSAQANRQAEDRLEGRVRVNAQRSEESLQKIQKTLEALLKEVKMGAGAGGGDGSVVDDVAAGAAGAAAAGGIGSFLKGAARRVGVVGGVMLGAAAVGAAGAYMLGGDSGDGDVGGSLGPAAGPSGTGNVPTPASDLAKMGGASAAVGASAGAAALISRSTMSAKQKALAKIAPKVPTYLSKFGGRIAATIGLKSIPIFGALVGGYFSFSRFMSGDSWQAIGYEFASGVAPDVGALGGPAGYVAGVASTMAIQTYLICRDIYQEENAIDIKNNVVPNFDDLEWSERAQVLNSVKGYVEAYVNSLIGRSSTSDATTGVSPTSTSGAALGGAGMAGAAAAGAAGANLTGAADSSTGDGSQMQGPPAAGGITTGAAQDIAEQRAVTPAGQTPTTTPQQTAYSQNLYGSSPTQASPAASPQVRSDVGGDSSQQSMGGSPSDTVATFNTSSNQGGEMYTGQDLAITEILETGKGYNVVRLTDGSVVKKTGTRNWRNNNPGNIEYGDFAKRNGAIGTDGRFAIFPDMNVGRGAKETLLFEGKNYRDKTIAQAISRYAPSFENNTGAYIASVSRAAGVDPNTPLASLDASQRNAMLNEMAKVEGLRPGKTEVVQPPQRMAEGGKITPLTADTPKAGKDLSADLQPPRETAMGKDEDTMSSSQSAIDARKRVTGSGVSKEKNRNSISSYAPYMAQIFGSMTNELKTFTGGEHTATQLFEDAMNPLS